MDLTVMHINKGNAHGTQGERSNPDNSQHTRLLLWDCRRSQTLPKIQGLQSKLKIKYETEKNNNKTFFEKKWVLTPM